MYFLYRRNIQNKSHSSAVSLTQHVDLDLGLILARIIHRLDGVRARITSTRHEHGQLGTVVLRVDVSVVAGAQLGAVQTPAGRGRWFALHADVELERCAGVDRDVPQVGAVDVRGSCGMGWEFSYYAVLEFWIWNY